MNHELSTLKAGFLKAKLDSPNRSLYLLIYNDTIKLKLIQEGIRKKTTPDMVWPIFRLIVTAL